MSYFCLSPTQDLLVMDIILLEISCYMPLFCVDSYQGKEVVGVEGYLMGNPDY